MRALLVPAAVVAAASLVPATGRSACSETAGVTWTRINDDRHPYAFTGEAIPGGPPVYGRVHVATDGRGVVSGDSAGRP